MKSHQINLDAIKVCYSTAIFTEKDQQEKSNIFLGIGLWSKSHGLTSGLPIDILTMIITADRLRHQSSSNANVGSIYIYIADNLALESRIDHPNINEGAILNKRDQTIKQIEKICQWLKIKNVVIDDSRTLANSPSYQQILKEIELRKSTLAVPDVQLEKTTENYVLKQTALIGFYQRERNCAVKVSWCFHENKINNHPFNIIKDGLSNKEYDELWFDAYYRLLCDENYPISFVYTQPGIALNTSSKNTSSPYFARDQLKYPRVLFDDSAEALLGNELETGKISRQITKGPSRKKGAIPTETPPAIPTETPPAIPTETPPAIPTETPPAVPTETPPTKFKYQLPPTFKKSILSILQELKENYADCITITSKKDEYNPAVIINDLLQITNFKNIDLVQNNLASTQPETSSLNYKFHLFNNTNKRKEGFNNDSIIQTRNTINVI